MDAPAAAPWSLEGLAPAPRAVPLSVKLDELFGGALSLFGWALLALGLAFAFLFVGSADFSAWRFHGDVRTALARATRCGSTHYSEGGRKGRPSSGHRIYVTDFVFDESGRAVSGSSYGYDCYQPGQTMMVEFPAGRPEYARIPGMRRAPLPPMVVWVLLFPGLGLAFVVSSLRTGLSDIRLLARGQLARAAVVGSRRTNVMINSRQQFELELSFVDAAGAERRFRTKTCFPERLEAPGAHNVFYDPDRPEAAIAVDALPEPLFADSSGGLSSDGWGRALAASAVPALIVAGFGVYWVIRVAPGSAEAWGRAALDLVLPLLFAVHHGLSRLVHLAL